MQYVLDVLPLPFKDQLQQQEMQALSLKNGELCEKWKEFLYTLPNSALEVIPHINERFWRWKNYLIYSPNEVQTNFHYTMTKGPKRDHKGILPIVGEELRVFREHHEIKLKSKLDVKHTHTKNRKHTKKDQHRN